MRISVKRNPYITMPHKVLQRLRVHSRFRHITAIRVAANMRRNIRHLNSIDIIISLHHMIKPMFPVHCHQWQAFVIQKQEPGVSIHHLFYLWLLPILNDGLEAFCKKILLLGEYTEEQIYDIEKQINNYPRKLFNGLSSNEYIHTLGY